MLERHHPRAVWFGPIKTINLKITLSRIASIESNQIWKITSKTFFEYRLEDGSNIHYVDVSVTITSVQTNNGSSKKGGCKEGRCSLPILPWK